MGRTFFEELGMNPIIVFSTISYQSRMIFRQKTFWFIQGLLLLVTYINTFQMMGTDASEADFVATIVGKGVCVFLFLATGFIVVPAALRNRGSIADLLWSTPLKTLEFTTGLFWGIYLPLVVTVFTTFVIHYLATYIPGATAVTPPIDMLFTYGVVPCWVVTALATSLYLALTLLLGSPLTVYALTGVFWVAWLSGIIEPTVTMLSPINFGLMTFTLSKSAGLGPDHPLVFSLYGLWLAMTFAGLMVLPWLLIWSQSSGFAHARKPFLGAMLVGVLVVAIAWANFDDKVKSAQVPVPSDSWQLNTWQVFGRNTELQLERGHVTGKTDLTLMNDGQAPIDTVLLELNAGLNVNSVYLENELLPFSRTGGSISVDLPNHIAPGDFIELYIDYSGSVVIPREDYAQSYALREEKVQQPLPIRAYLGNTSGYLMRDGDWEPWPYLVDTHIAQRDNFLSIKVDDHTGAVLSTASAVKSDTHNIQQHIWNGDIPPVIIAYGLVKASQPDTQSKAYFFTEPDEDDLSDSREYIEILKALSEWFGVDPPTSLRTAQLPYLNEIAWGNGVLFYPEPSQVMIYLKGISWRNPSPDAILLHRAYEVSLAWCRASLHWPSPSFIYMPNTSPQIPYGRIIPVSDATLDEALAWYSAIHVTASFHQDPGLVEQEIAFWQEVVNLNRSGAEQTLEAMAGRQTLFGQLAEHGIPYQSWGPARLESLGSEILALDEIYQTSGNQSFLTFLQLVFMKYKPVQSEILSAETFFALAKSIQN